MQAQYQANTTFYSYMQKNVETAGGNTSPIIGYFETPVTFRGKTKPISFYIIPVLQQDAYLDVDFWQSFGLLKLLTSNFSVSEVQVISEMNDLTSEQRKKLNRMIGLFPGFDKEGLGKTTVIEHSIEILPGAKPIKQRYFNVSPTVEEEAP